MSRVGFPRRLRSGAIVAAVEFAILLGIAALALPAQALTPIPRAWMQALQRDAQTRSCTLVGMLRSQPLSSPDGHWSAYSRIRYRVSPAAGAKLTSVLFAQDSRTGQLQVAYAPPLLLPSPATSPAAFDNHFLFLLPMEWQSEELLVREYEGVFQSNVAANQAVVWSPPNPDRRATLEVRSPDPLPPISYVLGWDDRPRGSSPETGQTHRILFVTGDWIDPPQQVSVGKNGDTAVVGKVPPADLEAIYADVNLATSVSPSAAIAEASQWSSGWPKVTGPLCQQ